jgi:hypothetical protein
MRPENVSRRDFHKLSAAALGGLIAGATLGCNEEATKPAKTAGTESGSATPPPADAGKTAVKDTVKETVTKSGAVAATTVALHACRGLNECKEQGKSHKNDCAGKGDCYTVKHDCSGKNDCKYQGGCGGENGLNDCKGKGGCGHFPIADADVWKKARTAFETRRKAAGKPVGPAPAAAKS